MKNIRFFLSENFQFLVVKISIYLNRRVFVMIFVCLALYQEIRVRCCASKTGLSPPVVFY